MNKILRARYQASTYAEIAFRVSKTVANSEEQFNQYHNIISKKLFIPSGNTLLAGVDPIRPNCAIIPPITDDNFQEMINISKVLWSDRIGLGMDLSQLDDPLQALKELSAINASIDLKHRPQRGNLAALNVNHPRIKEFIAYKSDTTNNIYNFNLSVGLENKDYDNEDILRFIAKHAHKCGDPAIINLDLIQNIPGTYSIGGKNIPLHHLGQMTTLVPCGENAMYPYEVCTLGAINLNSTEFFSNNQINVENLHNTIKIAIRFLDNVIDKMDINHPKLKAQSLHMRRVGLGLFGWADILNKLNMPYGSQDSLNLAHIVGYLFKKACHESSEELANELGICPALIGTGINRRNITLTSCMPTGGICLLTDNKGFGIEPLFSDLHKITANDHLNMQGVFQQYIDNCISKTINLSQDATEDDIITIWRKSRELGLKSVTVYRDKSKHNQPLTIGPSCRSGTCDLA